ncbi:type IV fimbrial biogenesis protein FimT [Pseudomonas sp. TE3786]
MRPHHGFTLPELLITLALLLMACGIALPNLNQYLHHKRQEDLRHSLQSHLKAARGEAIALMQRVELCGSSNGLQCDQAWAKGWLIRDPSSQRKLRYSRQQGQQQLRWAGAGATSQSVIYQANGSTVASNGRFLLCDAEGQVAWQLVINRQGRVRHVQGLESGQSDAELCR